MPVSAKQNGNALIIVLVVLSAVTFAIQSRMSKVTELARRADALEVQFDRQAWASAISERIDCTRVMSGFGPANPCPSGTSRQVSFIGESVLPATGPDGSQDLGNGWYVKASCGSQDLELRITRHVNGKYAIDPLSRKVLNFNDSATKVSDRPGALPICKGSFPGGGDTPVRLVSMSIPTLQRLATQTLPNGEMQYGWVSTCSAKAGIMSGLDDFPLAPYFRGGGTSGDPMVRGSSAEWLYEGNAVQPMMRDWYTSWGMPGNIQADWRLPAFYSGLGNQQCDRTCRLRFNANAGRMIRCDETIPDTAFPFETYGLDRSDGPVVCLCLR